MDFYLVLDRVIELLKNRGRASYRALQLQFDLDAEQFRTLRDELVNVHRVATDHEGTMLVWIGEGKQVPAPSAPTPLARATPGSAGERRQLTVMFCDLVDMTPLSSRLDPENLRDLVRAYQAASSEVVARYDGWVAQHLGDGLLIYFGFPRAHEDAAYGAVRAALDILEAMSALNAKLVAQGDARLAVRIGIDTGVVVVGEIGTGDRIEQLALGEAPNVAARLQGIATPDSAVISDATYRLVGQRVEVEDLGLRDLKGIERPVRVYRVVADRGSDERPLPGPERDSAAVVGRDAEFAFLLDRWALAEQARGQVILLSGEAGIGKSRLVEALIAEVQRRGHRSIAIRTSPYRVDSAFYPIIASLRAFLDPRMDASPLERLERLERGLEAAGRPLDDNVPLFAALLGIPLDGRYPALALTAEVQKRETREALVAWIFSDQERQSTLLVCEDLHWADPSTLEVLHLLAERAPATRVLAVLTFRPEFQPAFVQARTLTSLALGPLGSAHVRRIIDAVTGGRSVPDEVAEHIARSTDGNPLFVEEMTKAILELGVLAIVGDRYELTRPLASVAIPATLRDSLMARLDRLGSAKAIAQFGAVIGRRFAHALLRAVGSLDDVALAGELQRLVDSGLVFRRGVAADPSYLFKHALVHEGAYQSLLRRSRQQYHGMIARCLEREFPQVAAADPEVVAHHYTEAALADEAVPYWQRAGEKAMAGAAFAEAVNHLSRARSLLATLPEGRERDRREIDLLTALTRALWSVRGYAAPEVEQTVERAYALCEHEDDPDRRADVLMSQLIFYLLRAEYRTARERGEQLLALAQARAPERTLLEAHSSLGMIAIFVGRFGPAIEHFRTALLNYEPASHRSVSMRFGSDMGVTTLAYQARALWFLGQPDAALASAEKAVSLARQQGIPLSIAQAMGIYTHVLHQFHDDAQRTLDWNERTIAYATEHALPYWIAHGYILKSRIEAGQGNPEGNIAQIRSSLDRYRATGAVLGFTWFLSMLAEAYRIAGREGEASKVVAEALALVEQTDERYYEAELLRLDGELLLAQGDPEARHAAQAAFTRSLDVARGQGALSWELRAASSLARFWSGEGRRHDAHGLLHGVYARFTEGFESVDLRAARGLLGELARDT